MAATAWFTSPLNFLSSSIDLSLGKPILTMFCMSCSVNVSVGSSTGEGEVAGWGCSDPDREPDPDFLSEAGVPDPVFLSEEGVLLVSIEVSEADLAMASASCLSSKLWASLEEALTASSSV